MSVWNAIREFLAPSPPHIETSWACMDCFASGKDGVQAAAMHRIEKHGDPYALELLVGLHKGHDKAERAVDAAWEKNR